jgi:hypothetical protein
MHCKKHVFHHAVNLLDMYLASVDNVIDISLSLLGAVMLRLAIDVDCIAPLLEFWKTLHPLWRSLSLEEYKRKFIDLENHVLSTINFEISQTSTSIEWVSFYLQLACIEKPDYFRDYEAIHTGTDSRKFFVQLFKPAAMILDSLLCASHTYVPSILMLFSYAIDESFLAAVVFYHICSGISSNLIARSWSCRRSYRYH